jgi:hypothetical protein
VSLRLIKLLRLSTTGKVAAYRTCRYSHSEEPPDVPAFGYQGTTISFTPAFNSESRGCICQSYNDGDSSGEQLARNTDKISYILEYTPLYMPARDIEPIFVCPHFDILAIIYDPYYWSKNKCLVCDTSAHIISRMDNGRYIVVQGMRNLGGIPHPARLV